jgi:threonine-phosphate decarboxylase
VKKMLPIRHGGDILAVARSLGCSPAAVDDMSSNLAPFGPAPGVREALLARLDEIAYLPESGSESLRDCLAARYNRGREEILAGNGTTEFIFALPAGLRPRVGVVVNPSYGDYRLACSWAGVEVRDFNLDPADDFVLDLPRLAGSLEGGELVFLCNPNNPTGALTPSRQLHEFIARHRASHFLVDEAYLPFTGEESLLDLPPLDNLLVLQSYSKIYCIPGLRLGLMVGPARLLARLREYSKPWGVNRLAQVAGEYLCQNADAYVAEVASFVARERKIVAEQMAELPGVTVVPGQANFLLGRLGQGLPGAGELRQLLLQRRFIIRDCANFTGLDERYFRLSLKDSATNRRCLQALAEIIEPGP